MVEQTRHPAYSFTFVFVTGGEQCNSPSKRCRFKLAMSQCEETEEKGHHSETPLHGQHSSQTEAQSCSITRRSSKYQSMDFKGSSSFKSLSEDEEGVAEDIDLVQSSDEIVFITCSRSKYDDMDFKGSSSLKFPVKHTASTGSICLSMKRESSQGRINTKTRHPSLRKSSFSEEEDNVAEDIDLVQSSDDLLQERLRTLLISGFREGDHWDKLW
ncbi:uncharacterized protein LOC119910687 [Micropterus salmoides]|uniref:uncharacterized protein LOC119910687 n=1 Tax=Micropterus salmoides TaxID=27706 RepID=UPI0018EBBADD|nr:uncharacterized protein LOC119910687 [Micropterus salmoides]